MAICPAVPGLKVEVVVHGAPLTERADDEDDGGPKTVTNYVEAKSGEEFGVRITCVPPFQTKYDLVVDVALDGLFVRGVILYNADLNTENYSFTMSYATSYINHRWCKQSFCFSGLTIGDNHHVNADQNTNFKALGNICVQAYFVRAGKAIDTVKRAENLPQFGEISEKALKGSALSHQTRLGEPTPTTEPRTRHVEYVGSKREPFAKFNFKYRSKHALKALCILPRSPSPVPLEDRPEEELTREELIELLRRRRLRDGTTMKRELKRERSEEVQTNGAVHDDEVTVVSAKRRRLPSDRTGDDVEVIDLT